MHTAITAIIGILLLMATGALAQNGRLIESAATSEFQHTQRGDLREFLAKHYRLTAEDITKVDAGEPVIRVLPSDDRREFIIMGITRVSAAAMTLTRYSRDVQNVGRTRFVRETGLISPQHVSSDVRSIHLMQGDVDALGSCRVGDCDLKLPAETIARIQQIDHTAQGSREMSAAAFHEWLVDYLLGYLEIGNDALVTYHDRPEAQNAQLGFADLLDRSEPLQSGAPALLAHLQGIGPPLSADYFWSVEDFGMRPLTTVTEVAVYQPDSHEAWVAFKLLYASHYLQASLRLMHMVEEPTSETTTSVLITVDRLLFDSEIGGLKRMLLSKHLESYADQRLQSVSANLRSEESLIALRKN